MKYIVTQEIKSETKVVWVLYLRDFGFLVVWIGLCFLLQKYVHDALHVPYIIFSILMGIALMLPSRTNPKRRMYQAVALFLKRPKETFCIEVKEKKDEIKRASGGHQPDRIRRRKRVL